MTLQNVPTDSGNEAWGMCNGFDLRSRIASGLVLLALFLSGAAQSQESMRVATIERKPFAFQLEGEWAGFSIELWQRISDNLGFDTTFVSNESFPEMLSRVASGDVDLAAANISVTEAREKVMDFSQPIFDSGLIILAEAQSRSSIFSAIANRDLWYWIAGAICLFILAGMLIAFFERRHQHFEGRDQGSSVSEGIWWAVSVVTNASFTIFTPMSIAGRLLSYALILVGLFVVSAFVAQITASLTVESLKSQVNSHNDLRGKRVGTTEGSTSSRFLTEQSIEHVTFAGLDPLFAALEAGDLQAVVHDAPILAYYATTNGDGKYRTVGRVFNPEKYGFAMPQGSPHSEAINQEILRLRESGDFAQLVSKWFGASYQ